MHVTIVPVLCYILQIMKKIAILLHDIRSTHNVGSMFRTAESAGVGMVYLSGYTPTPLDKFGRARKDIAKVALGAEKTLSWKYESSPEALIKKLKKEKYQIVGIEQSKDSIDYKKVKIKEKVLFIVGNEVLGISSALMDVCDVVAQIPMKGKKESLNVSVAFGIGLFRMLGI
jgi:23S rRNA (guanosine2251-2'-O)-methyltransferase